MGIKRGVSIYSYQQAEWFHEMLWKDQLREVATNLDGATGIEIISECTVPKYPFPPESFLFDWNNEMARWGLVPVAFDTYLDTLQFRDHVMTHAETALRIQNDLRIAKRMGFSHMRLCGGTPMDSVAMALPLAEELDICMTVEIHAPATIKPKPGSDRVAEVVATIQKLGTKHLGLQPDMGIFQKRPSSVALGYGLRRIMPKDKADALTKELLEVFDDIGREAFLGEYVPSKHPEIANSLGYGWMTNDVSPVDLYDIMPYIRVIHGKFYKMEEIPGRPGQYHDPSIAEYEDAITVLKKGGYDGYINSEFEGQRSQQDVPRDQFLDEVQEVRRHHEMLKRLIGA